MAAAYAIGAAVPLLPFAVGLAGGLALVVATALTGLTRFLPGVGKATLSHQRPVRSGMEMLVLASAAGVAGYLIGVTPERGSESTSSCEVGFSPRLGVPSPV